MIILLREAQIGLHERIPQRKAHAFLRHNEENRNNKRQVAFFEFCFISCLQMVVVMLFRSSALSIQLKSSYPEKDD